ncbi:hypothetical protein [Acinetobacter bohemicus]|uniref:hypothetical protein n=1 Tax=Acinetobacter bohemicus TaxID=1435036 RepID=UPI0040414273
MDITDVIKQWEETEQEIRLRLGVPDAVHLSELTKRSGLEEVTHLLLTNSKLELTAATPAKYP